MTLVGEMDRQITIRRWGSVKDAAGGLREVNTDAWTLWAKIENRKGSVVTNNQQMTWTYLYAYTCYYDIDKPIFSNDTIDYDGYRMRISNTSIITEGNRELVEITSSTTGVAITDNLSAMISTVNYTGTGNEGVKTIILVLINKVVKAAFKDGIEFKVIGMSDILDPDQKQVQVNPTTGHQEWTVPFVVGENAMLMYADI